MSLRGAIAGSMRALLVAAATAGAAFGLLAVFHPFSAATTAPAVLAAPQADALHRQIDAARVALRNTESTIAVLRGQPSAIAAPDPALGIEAQIAAVTDRRDVARREATAIREALETHADLGALAQIRDSVVVGQLLTQLSTLDATIAEQGARFRSSHPTMRGLAAQRTALLARIAAGAASIAAALDASVKLDDAQLAQLHSDRAAPSAAPLDGAPNLAALEAEAAGERVALDALIDGYFGLPPPTAAPPSDPLLSDLSPLNLFVVAVAAAAALAAQIGFALRRRWLRRDGDLSRWRADHDTERPAEATAAPSSTTNLRRAS